MVLDYSIVTELPGSKVTKLQLQREYNRYKFGSVLCEGKDVLEVACGGGQGLGLLARKARKVVGGDCDKTNLSYAVSTYKGRDNIEVVEIDAHNLQFNEGAFDVILLYEAIYYLKSPEKFLKECKRVLRKDGIVIICTANKDWPDFNPSPYSYRYFSVPELKQLFEGEGFGVEFFGAFPDYRATLSSKIKSLIKRTAVKFNLMPKTMKCKFLLKKMFYGEMVELPRELADGMLDYEPPRPISNDKVDILHTAVYAVVKLK